MKKLYACAECGYESFQQDDFRKFFDENYCPWCIGVLYPPVETADKEVEDDYKPNC
jgi:hypothetical protein